MPSQTSQKNQSVSIYWDLQNVPPNPEKINALINFSKSKGKAKNLNVYLNLELISQASTKDELQKVGFTCINVPCPLKNSADNQLKSDLIDDMHDHPSDVVILVSGDGDFKNIVKSLRKEGKYVIVISRKGNVKQFYPELSL
jgi:NYN domain